MVRLQNVSFGYTKDFGTLEGVDLTIHTGECLLLCGESGCGKTTVTKLINGLIPAFTEGCVLTGTVFVDDNLVTDMRLYELAERVGSVFQNPKSQFFNLDSDSELAFGLENQGMEPAEIQRRIDVTVQKLQIENLLGRSIFAMSGGEKQLLAFASVYAMGPDIYVLDEPTANLDAGAIRRLHDQIALLKSQGRTVIIAEHRLWFLTDLIDRAVYLEDGRITRIWNGETFRGLSERERVDLGLRALKPVRLDLPAPCPGGEQRGLSVEGLTCTYDKGQPVFRDVSFSAGPGEALAITGENGVGKTTLARCLSGLLREAAGAISLDGKKLNPKQRQRAAFCVMQDVNHQLFSDSVWGECEMTAPNASGEQIEAVLRRLQLLELRDKHPMALSGGQKQRLAIATAILSRKRILIFDEPTSGLDYARMQSVAQVVRELAAQGRVVLVVTHDDEFARCACDRALRLMKGGASHDGPPDR